jgi:hypothetical protein
LRERSRPDDFAEIDVVDGGGAGCRVRTKMLLASVTVASRVGVSAPNIDRVAVQCNPILGVVPKMVTLANVRAPFRLKAASPNAPPGWPVPDELPPMTVFPAIVLLVRMTVPP